MEPLHSTVLKNGRATAECRQPGHIDENRASSSGAGAFLCTILLLCGDIQTTPGPGDYQLTKGDFQHIPVAHGPTVVTEPVLLHYLCGERFHTAR